MFCLMLTGPCCCGPCETRVTTGSSVIFLFNLASCLVTSALCLFLFKTPVALVAGAILAVLAFTNILGYLGVQKSATFLPLPSTWKGKQTAREKVGYCLLVPWLIVYGFITLLCVFVFVPVCVLAVTKMVNVGFDPFTFCLLAVESFLATILPYQLSVVYRCFLVVRKGGQHYIVPDTQVYPWSDTTSVASVTTQISQEDEVK